MRDFLSEYGFAILAAIVVILLIAMCTPVGSLILKQVSGVVGGFSDKTETKLYSMNASGEVGIAVAQLDENGKFSIEATSDSETDTLKAEYRIKDQHGNWSDWKELGTLSVGEKTHEAEFTTKIENGNKVQVRVTDEGKANNVYYESEIITYTGKTYSGDTKFQVGLAPGIYNSKDELLISWEDLGVPAEDIEVDYANVKQSKIYNAVWSKYQTTAYRIVLPEGITRIGDRQFSWLYYTRYIDIPSTVTAIGNYSFKMCTELKEANIPDSVTYMAYGAFSGCANLISANISKGLGGIPYYTFQDCYKLKEITLPSNIQFIGQNAFTNCKILDTVNIEGTIKAVHPQAFTSCPKLSVDFINSLTSSTKASIGVDVLRSAIISGKNALNFRSFLSYPSTTNCINYGYIYTYFSNYDDIKTLGYDWDTTIAFTGVNKDTGALTDPISQVGYSKYSSYSAQYTVNGVSFNMTGIEDRVLFIRAYAVIKENDDEGYKVIYSDMAYTTFEDATNGNWYLYKG